MTLAQRRAKLLEPGLLARAKLVCPECEADGIIKYGIRGGLQVYKCKPCNKKFTDNGAMPGRRIPPAVVGDAITAFFDGLSYRDIMRRIDAAHGFKPSTATIYEWVRDYTKHGKRLTEQFKAQTGDTWVADETVLKVDGGKLWLWNVMDAKTRFLLATHISRVRTTNDAAALFRKAKRRADHKPKTVVTDKLRAYQDGIERVFGGDTKHVQSEGIRDELNNNLSERLQGTIKERTKVMRGLEFKRTAEVFVDGFALHYNHMKPHIGIRERTPAEAAGLPFRFKGWTEVAHLDDDTFREPLRERRFIDQTFRRRRGL